MKNYVQPELTISLFDVEDVITASGITSNAGKLTSGYAAAEAEFGGLYADRALTTPATTQDSVVYFSWN